MVDLMCYTYVSKLVSTQGGDTCMAQNERLLDTLCELRNRYVLRYAGKPKPADYNQVLADYDAMLRKAAEQE